MKSKERFERLVQDWPVKILAVVAALVLFWFNRVTSLEERFFSVPVKLLVDERYMPAAHYPNQVRVTMKGDAGVIFLISENDIEAVADLRKHDVEGVFKVPIEIRKSGTALDIDPLEIRTEPLELTIPLERKVTKYLEVTPVFEGRPTPGYELVQSFVSPTTVSVEGPRSHMVRLSAINTQPIDLSGKKEDFSVRVRVDTPDPLLRVRSSDTVEFRANMEETVVVKTYENAAIITLGLSPDLKIGSPLPAGKITVQGSQVFQEGLALEQVRLTVDVSHVRFPGTYTLPLEPDLPGDVVVLGFEPSEVTVRVEANGITSN